MWPSAQGVRPASTLGGASTAGEAQSISSPSLISLVPRAWLASETPRVSAGLGGRPVYLTSWLCAGEKKWASVTETVLGHQKPENGLEAGEGMWVWLLIFLL